MIKEEKKIKYLLTLGVVILFFAGISFLLSPVDSEALKLLINTLIGAGILSVGIMVENKLKLRNVGELTFGIGLLSLVASYIFLGVSSLFSKTVLSPEWFMFTLYILIAVLALIMLLRYREYKMIYLICTSIFLAIATLVQIVTSTLYIVLVVMSILFFLLSIISHNKYIENFLKFAVFIYGVISLCLLSSGEFVYLSLFILINIINSFIIANKEKKAFVSILSLLFTFISVVVYMNHAIDIFDKDLVYIIGVMMISLSEILLSYFKITEDDGLLTFYKIITNVFYLYVVVLSNCSLIVNVFILLVSFVNSFVYKNDETEPYLFLAKLSILIYALKIKFDLDIMTLGIVLDLVYIFVNKFIKKDLLKTQSLWFSLLPVFIICSSNFESEALINYLALMIIIILNYLIFIRIDKLSDNKYHWYYGFLVNLIILTPTILSAVFSSYPPIYGLLIYVLGLLVLLIINIDERINFMLTVPILTYYLTLLINCLDINIWAIIILTSLVINLGIALFTLKIKENSSPNDLLTVFYIASSILLFLFYQAERLLVLGTILFFSVIYMFYSLNDKNKEKKFLFVASLIISIICLLGIIDDLGGLTTFAYLLFLGVAIIIIVIRLINKSSKVLTETIEEEKEEKEEKKVKPEKEEVKEKIIEEESKFCPNCGSKIEDKINFCGECGHKL